MALSAQPQTRYHLLELPAELRNRIYELCLTIEPKGRAVFVKRRSDHQLCFHSVLGILETCRAIHNEASALFYTYNSNLVFEDANDFVDLIKTSKPAALLEIRRVEVVKQSINTPYVELDVFWQAFLSLPNLEAVHVAMRPMEASANVSSRRVNEKRDVILKTLRKLAKLSNFKLVLVWDSLYARSYQTSSARLGEAVKKLWKEAGKDVRSQER